MKDQNERPDVDNVKKLRDDLLQTYALLRSGEVGISEAKSVANMAGKIMSTAKTQLEYNKFAGDNNKKIQFLESDC